MVSHQSGFTLIELVMVIVITGVIAAIATVFLRYPVEGYVASARRAAVADTADTAVRRIARDLQRALPNSVRTADSNTACIEFVPVKLSGRYRSEDYDTDDGEALDFTQQDSKFNMLWNDEALPTKQRIVAGDYVVVYNLGITGASIYDADNYSLVTDDVTYDNNEETTINIEAKQFPLESGSKRFQLVAASEMQVAYVCSGSTLYRTASTALTAAASCPTTGDVIASNVDCANTSFTFEGTDLQRNGLVSIRLALQNSTETESVSLYHEVHVANTP